jgi:hypothetical protein
MARLGGRTATRGELPILTSDFPRLSLSSNKAVGCRAMRFTFFLFVTLWTAVAQGELSEGMRAWVDKVERYRLQSIEHFSDTRWNREVDGAKRKEAKKKVALARKVHTLEYPDEFVGPSLARDAKVGDVGQVDGAIVNRILDEQTLIIDVTESYVSQRRQHTRVTGSYLVKGIDTAGLADDRPVKLPKLMEITGSQQQGVKTLLVIEPVDVAAIRPEVDAYLAAKKKRAKSTAKPTPAARQ